MILKRLKLNSLIENIVTNCYIIEDEETKETMVIDPAGELEKITERKGRGLKITISLFLFLRESSYL